jgi:AcrR family transcriptional regulator
MSPEELLPKCLKYFLRHGVAHLSLRPLAASVGTSARMLVHHFGSKEDLIAAVMAKVRDRLQALLRTVDEVRPSNAATVLLGFWKLATAREHLPYLRLLLEVQVLALQNPRRYRGYLESTSNSWLRLVEATLPGVKDRRAMATLCTAVIDGLMLELLSTGDSRRTLNALTLFTESCFRDKRGGRKRS